MISDESRLLSVNIIRTGSSPASPHAHRRVIGSSAESCLQPLSQPTIPPPYLYSTAQICAVCSQPIDVTYKYEDRDEVKEYHMHDLCADNTLGSWDNF